MTEFAVELHELFLAVLPTPVEPFSIAIATGSPTHVIVRQPSDGIALTVDGEPLLRLHARFRCTWDSRQQFLAVNESSIGVSAEGSEEPLFRYDYISTSDGHVPAAHLNVHGHRDELVFAMMAAGKRHRGRARVATVRKGRIPRLANFHFALGGHRFRPAVEDVLEMTVREFGLDTRAGWESAICQGRARWREKQLRSAVRDDPTSAADTLRNLGYAITPPPEVAGPRADRIHSL
ncbi:MAG: hypothetical protein HGA44_21830 [Cellulomonadaceae bacterium]|nr:hypothetical protein [Cellulomonadaceae bacterium]